MQVCSRSAGLSARQRVAAGSLGARFGSLGSAASAAAWPARTGRRRRPAAAPAAAVGLRDGRAARRDARGSSAAAAARTPARGIGRRAASAATGRPCLSYSTAGPAAPGCAALARVELPLHLVELGLRLLGHLLGLVQESHAESSLGSPPRRRQLNPTAARCAFKASVKRRGTCGVLALLPQRHDEQLAARAVLQADER